MKRSNIILVLVGFFGLLFSSDLKIGYIDSQKILSELEEVREVQIELEKKQREWEGEMETLIGRRDSLFQAEARRCKNIIEFRSFRKKPSV